MSCCGPWPHGYPAQIMLADFVMQVWPTWPAKTAALGGIAGASADTALPTGRPCYHRVLSRARSPCTDMPALRPLPIASTNT